MLALLYRRRFLLTEHSIEVARSSISVIAISIRIGLHRLTLTRKSPFTLRAEPLTITLTSLLDIIPAHPGLRYSPFDIRKFIGVNTKVLVNEMF